MKLLKNLLIATPILLSSHLSYADWVKDAVLKNDTDTVNTRHYIHQNPELGNIEYNTSKLVQNKLKSYGIQVKTGYAKTGVIGILKGAKAGPVVALRADMDALPVLEKTGLSFASKAKAQYHGKEVPVMHACGHDTHTAMLLGAAKVLAEHKDQISGTVIFLFQPAEEGGADIDDFTHGDQVGARKMIADGALNTPKPEAIFGLHVISGLPTGNLYYKSGAMLNSADEFRIKLIGKQVHGSMPWGGQDPIVTSAQVINNLQTLISRKSDLTKGMGVVTVGTIQGGVASNIIPEDVSLTGTIRTNSEEIRQNILKKLPEMVKNTALANETKAEVELSSYAPVTSNDKALTTLMANSLEKVVGQEKLHYMDNNVSPSEDFAYYGQLMPSMFVLLGATPADQDMSKAAPNHSPEFMVDDATLKTGVEAHVRFVLDYPTIQAQLKQ